MDRALRESGRLGDLVRTGHLLRRAGRSGEALSAFAAAWRGPAGARAEDAIGELLAEAAPEERLELAPALEELAAAGLPGADELLAAWFPAAADVVGSSPAARALRGFLYRQAQGAAPVLLWGEPGVGRALAARTLHRLIGRAGFHEAYAPQRTARLLEEVAERAPAGGTLYLSYADPHDAERWAEPLLALCAARGARLVIGATGQPLEGALAAIEARLELPPLRERLEDLPLLVAALLARAGAPQAARALDPKLIGMLRWHDWPGNVRELANHVARAVLAAGDRLAEVPEQLLQGLFGLPGEVGEELPASPED